jgi:hypothetical protein
MTLPTTHRRFKPPALLGCAMAMVVGAFAHGALARRAPSPGGSVSVAVPAELLPTFIEAHAYVPLFEPRQLTDDVGVPGAPEHSSRVVDAVSHSDDDRTWRLEVRAPPQEVAHAIGRCLAGRNERRFPVDALRAAGVVADVSVTGGDVTIVFNKPVGVFPELLSWCPLRPSVGTPTGPYALSAPGRLSWRSGGFMAPPLLGAVELREAENAERADVVIAPSGDTPGATGALLAPWPDVIVLVQSTDTALADPFALNDDEKGLSGFRQTLRADLLVAAWASGRGGPTEALLPPGVAPARPLPPITSTTTAPLSLTPVPSGGPRLPLFVAEGDILSDAVAERLAVLLRGRGIVLDVRRVSRGDDGGELVRWRPPSRDAALSLLSFVGERDGLASDKDVETALADGRLLARDPELRLAAALVLERALLDSRLVVPVVVIERIVAVDADLRGVVIRGDGIPLLDGAWWGGGR